MNAFSSLEQSKRSNDYIYFRPSDYFTGEIKKGNEVVCNVIGSYLSFVVFDGVRYWDVRENISISVLIF